MSDSQFRRVSDDVVLMFGREAYENSVGSSSDPELVTVIRPDRVQKFEELAQPCLGSLF